MPQDARSEARGIVDLAFGFSPTVSRFIRSLKEVIVLIGPQGEGKTWGALWGIVEWALDHQRRGARLPISGAIIRDTHTNMKKHTVKSINKMLGQVVHFKDDYKAMLIPGLLECDLFGIDDPAGLNKLQASEYHIKWIEEPAPIVDTGNAGIREDVFDVCCARGPREQGARHRVEVTLNPASEEHWTYHRFIDDPQANMEVFRIPRGENKFLDEEERERVRRAYAHRPDLLARYDRGEFSFVTIGEAVMPEYNERYHRSEGKLDPIPKVAGIRFWDGGLYPSCVIAQLTPRGRLIVLDTLRGDNMGMKQFIQTQVKPLMLARYKDVPRWRDLGDPALDNREQSDSAVTAASIINGELGAAFEGGEAGWQARKEAMKELLNRMVDGEPMFQVSKHEGILHRALRGGWHYHKDNAGRIMRDKPVKDINSHPADALSHGIARIFHYVQTPFTRRVDTSRLAKSYGARSLP